MPMPRENRDVSPRKKSQKEDARKTSQKLLLTWLIEKKDLYEKIRAYISPEDFTEPLYREVAEKLFEQLRSGQVNPARILGDYEESDQQREVAALFNASVQVENKGDFEKALNETVYRVMQNSLEYRTAHMDPTDMNALQQLIADKRRMEAI